MSNSHIGGFPSLRWYHNVPYTHPANVRGGPTTLVCFSLIPLHTLERWNTRECPSYSISRRFRQLDQPWSSKIYLLDDLLWNSMVHLLRNSMVNLLCNSVVNLLCNSVVNLLCNSVVNLLWNSSTAIPRNSLGTGSKQWPRAPSSPDWFPQSDGPFSITQIHNHIFFSSAQQTNFSVFDQHSKLIFQLK